MSLDSGCDGDVYADGFDLVSALSAPADDVLYLPVAANEPFICMNWTGCIGAEMNTF